MISTETYREIQGWLSDREAKALQIIADGCRVVEVGCWKAKSSIAMAATAKSVLTIDHFRGDLYTGLAFTLPEAIENIRKHDSDGKISILIQDFFGIKEGEMKDMIMLSDVLYYDGDHSEQSVRKLTDFVIDFDNMPIIAFHDYESSPAYQSGKDVFDALVKELIDHGFASDCLAVIDRLAIIVPPHYKTRVQNQLRELAHE